MRQSDSNHLSITVTIADLNIKKLSYFVDKFVSISYNTNMQVLTTRLLIQFS